MNKSYTSYFTSENIRIPEYLKSVFHNQDIQHFKDGFLISPYMMLFFSIHFCKPISLSMISKDSLGNSMKEDPSSLKSLADRSPTTTSELGDDLLFHIQS